jgi:hypothetical protein
MPKISAVAADPMNHYYRHELGRAVSLFRVSADYDRVLPLPVFIDKAGHFV